MSAPSTSSPPSLSTLLSTLILLFQILIYIFVSIRLWIRIRVRKISGDDLFLVFSVIATTTSFTLLLLSVNTGLGNLIANPNSAIPLKQYFFASLATLVSALLLRLSALIYLYSLSTPLPPKPVAPKRQSSPSPSSTAPNAPPVVSKPSSSPDKPSNAVPSPSPRNFSRTVITTLSISLTTYSVFYFLLILLQCVPMGDNFSSPAPTSNEGTCIANKALNRMRRINAGVCGLVDLSLAVGLPVWIIVGFGRRRVGIGGMGVMGVGCLAAIASLLRITASSYPSALRSSPESTTHDNNNILYNSIPIVFCEVLEPGFGSIAVAAAGFGVRRPKKQEKKEGGGGGGEEQKNGGGKESV